MEERLACMLVAYMTFESATYTQKAVSSHTKRLKLERASASATRTRPEPARAAKVGAMRSSGEALIVVTAPGSGVAAAPWDASVRPTAPSMLTLRGARGRARQRQGRVRTRPRPRAPASCRWLFFRAREHAPARAAAAVRTRQRQGSTRALPASRR